MKYLFHFCKKFELCLFSSVLVLIHDVNPPHATARRGPAAHRADLVKWLREALLAARRGPVVHSAAILVLLVVVTCLMFSVQLSSAVLQLKLLINLTD